MTSEPSEVCGCPAPYEGESCERCRTGWFMSSVSGDCQLCQCNGLSDSCLDGNGTCLVRKELNQTRLFHLCVLYRVVAATALVQGVMFVSMVTMMLTPLTLESLASHVPVLL